MATPGGSAQQASASSPGGPRRRLETADCDVVTEEDHISRLTEDLLLDVLAHLGCAREAARTSVLARRWRGLWTRLPELTFDHLDIPFHTLEGLLAQITSPALNLLHIGIRHWDDVTPEHVSSLLRAAARLAPMTFHLQLNAEHYSRAVELPCFDRTTSLWLELPYMDLEPPPGGQFSALERLVLYSSNLEPGSLLPMCPSLRSLHFEPCEKFYVVTVHSTTLEELVIISQHDEGSCDIDHIDIMTPQLKKVDFRISWGDDFSMPFSAPLVEDIEVDCMFQYGNVGLEYIRLSRLKYLLKRGVHELQLDICPWDRLPYVELLWRDLDRSFEEEITRLPFSQFSILVLNLETEEHGFGPLVLHLLQIRPVRMLKVYLRRASKVSCPLDCPCDQHTNWRNESISLTELEVVKIYGLKGEDDEAEFLQVLFRSATALKSMTVEVSPTGYNKVCGICEQYPQAAIRVMRRQERVQEQALPPPPGPEEEEALPPPPGPEEEAERQRQDQWWSQVRAEILGQRSWAEEEEKSEDPEEKRVL